MLWSAHLLHKTKPFRLCTTSLSESISEFGLELDSVFLLQDKTFEIIVQLPFCEHFRAWVRLGLSFFLQNKTFKSIEQLPFWEHFRAWVRLGFLFFYKTKSLRLLLRFAYTVESFGNQSGVRWEEAATSVVPLLPTLPRYLPHPFCSSSASSQSHYHHRDTPKETPQKPTKTLQQINSKKLTKAHKSSNHRQQKGIVLFFAGCLLPRLA
jgi:hypothetical protein